MRDRTENQIELYLIRHGMTASNEEHRYLGRTDEPLSETGIRLLKERAEKWNIPSPGLVFCSPMKRCVESAHLLFPSAPVLEIPEWEEMDFGAFEGKNYVELNGNPDYQAWIDSGGKIAFPGGETREAFISRCVGGMENALEFLSNRMIQQICPACDCGGKNCVAVVVHGGTIMALLSHYIGGDYYGYQVENARGYYCRLRIKGSERLLELRGKL